MKKILFILIALAFVGSEVAAAVKIDTAFVASNRRHLLFYSIPDNYDASKKYPLVVGLHYCGGTAKSYRNSLTPLADSLQAIIVCPDNSSSQIPDSQTDIVTAAADSARKAFSIDTTAMFLTGMSCNGEFTLRQGLKKFYPFTGIFPWVPWIQSKNQFKTNYLIKSDMPTVLAVGNYDDNFAVLMSLYDSLRAEGANINLVLALGVGHSEIFNTFGVTMIKCVRYLMSPKTISMSRIEDIQMVNTDPGKEVSVDITNAGNKELQVKIISSFDHITAISDFVYNAASGKVTFKITPKAGKYGNVKVIVEANEKDGSALGQSVFNVKVEKPTASSSIGAATNKLMVSPNLANRFITLESQTTIHDYAIFDLSGKRLLDGNIAGKKGVIDISGLQKGNYLITTPAIAEATKFCVE
jgi:hypothetical protein